ncbi:unnamed protein product, partial [Closterium sp. Naga37s-1]
VRSDHPPQHSMWSTLLHRPTPLPSPSCSLSSYFAPPTKFDPATHRVTGSNDLNLVNLFSLTLSLTPLSPLCLRPSPHQF